MTVHEFPEGKSLKRNLEERRDELAELHDTLRRAYELTHRLEDKVDGLEMEYNHFLQRYTKAVGGIENVEVGFLEYGSDVSIDVDSGEIVFTPWSDDDET